MNAPRTRFVAIQVEEHEEIPEGCSLRFKAQDDGRVVRFVAWESEDGEEGTWAVEAASSIGPAPATAFLVDDSSAGTSLLIVGGDHGLRLTSARGARASASYLLVAPDAERDAF